MIGNAVFERFREDLLRIFYGVESVVKYVIEYRGGIPLVRGESRPFVACETLESVAQSVVEEQAYRPFVIETRFVKRMVEIAADDDACDAPSVVLFRAQRDHRVKELPARKFAFEAVQNRLLLFVQIFRDVVAFQMHIECGEQIRSDFKNGVSVAARRKNEIRRMPRFGAGFERFEARENRDLLQADDAVCAVDRFGERGANDGFEGGVVKTRGERVAGRGVADFLREEDVRHTLSADDSGGLFYAFEFFFRRLRFHVTRREPAHIPRRDLKCLPRRRREYPAQHGGDNDCDACGQTPNFYA